MLRDAARGCFSGLSMSTFRPFGSSLAEPFTS